MADHSKPTLTSTYSNFLSEVDGRIDDLAVGLDPAVTTATNVPTGAIRWNSASSKWEKWSGTAWDDLSASYNINLAGPLTLTANSSSDALRITQTGAGNSLVVEDSANPDSTPFVIDTQGRVLNGYSTSIDLGLTRETKYQQHATTIINSSATFGLWAASSAGQETILAKSRGAVGVYTASLSNDDIAKFRFVASDGTGMVDAAQISAAVDGTPGTNDMPGRLVFSTTADGASTPTERMRINSAGKVNIGPATTSSAQVALYVRPDGDFAGINYGTFTRQNLTSAATGYYAFINETSINAGATVSYVVGYMSSQGTFSSTPTSQYGFYANADLTDATNNYGFYSNIDSGTGRWNFHAAGTADNYFVGNLLRGTSTTAVATIAGSTSHTPGLQIHGNSLSAASSAQFAWNTGNYFTFNRSASGSVGTYTAVSDNDTLGAIQFNGTDGTEFVGSAQIRGAVNGTVGSNDVPGMLQFYTRQQGAGLLERLRIDSAGRCDMQTNMASGGGTGTASSISGTTLTVGGTVTGTFSVGDRVFGPNVEPNTFITGLGTGTGGAGTYTVSNSQTAASGVITSISGGNNVFRFTDTDTAVAANQPMGMIEWYNVDASVPGAGVKAYIAGISESITPDSALIFGTANNVASTQAIERWRINSDGTLTAATGSGLSIARTAVTAPAASDGNVFSGTYTPTQVSTNTNVTTVSFTACQYMRVGSVVTVSGRLGITATATGNTVVRISFPIASATSSTIQCGGVAASATSTVANNTYLTITTDTTNDCVQFQGNSTVAGSAVTFFFSFTYQVA